MVRRVRADLGRGFIFVVAAKSTSKDFDVTEPKNREKWIKEHGKSVLDFGAGHLHETNILRSIGVNVTPFEPYRVNESEEIDKFESLRVVDEFLEDVGTKKVPYTSIFISSVLNSVPYAEDRRHIVCMASLFASFFHDGGEVGITHTRASVFPASMFANAPRFHEGLMPDEFPAILQKGETVLPKNSKMGGVNVVFNISTPNAQSFKESQGQIMAKYATALQRYKNRNN